MDDLRNTVHGDFQRNGDLLFHLLGRDSRPLGNDLHIVVGDVGVGLDRQALERNNSGGEQEQGERQDEQAVVESKINNSPNHCSTVFSNGSAWETTRSPGLIPETISCMFPGNMLPVVT